MISVIVPVFNVEPYLRECLDSIVTQTYTDLQIIIVDDGSTDGSGAICDAYAAGDARIQVIHQENRGLSAARNRGIELATGEYLNFVDSDDYMQPDCIETLLRLCIEYDADMSICAYHLLQDKKITPIISKHTSKPDPEIFTGMQKMEAHLKQGKFSVCAWGKLYASNIFRNIRYPEGRVYEDSAIFHLLVHSANRIVCTQKSAYVYRKRSGSITTSPFSAQNLDILASRVDLYNFTEKNYPTLLPHALIALTAACSILVRKIAQEEKSFPDIEHRLQAYCRNHWILYLRHGPSIKSKLFVLLICLNIKLAKYIAQLYSKFLKN